MKRISLAVLLLVMCVGTSAEAAQQTIIFLHNAWFEKHKDGEAHPKYGAYDFAGIKEALAAGGQVVAPERGPDAKSHAAAADLMKRVEALMSRGVRASDIKIIGASKGAAIAQIASEAMGNPDLRWVLVGGCHVERMAGGAAPEMTGSVLSIYEVSDQVAGPCKDYPALTQNAARFQEKSVDIGNGHGFQFSADPAWIKPALAW